MLGAGNPEGPLKCLLFDAFHNEFRGVVCLVEVIDGVLRRGTRITAASSGDQWEVAELGVMAPEAIQMDALYTGQALAWAQHTCCGTFC